MFEGLKDKKVLITGASGGIGASISRLFASCGAVIGIHYNEHKTEAVALREEIRREGGKADCFQGNLLVHATCADLVRAFVDGAGGLDVLINNAGAVFGAREFTEVDEMSWDQTLALNAKAPFFLAGQAFGYMKQQRGGKIINMSSVSAKYGGSPKTVHYGAAKAALDAMTVGMARIGAPYNILVNSIRSGFIDTPFHQKMGRQDKNERIGLIPLKRSGQPIDVARMAMFLASDAGNFITGEIIAVAGGD